MVGQEKRIEINMIIYKNIFDEQFCDYVVDYIKTKCPISHTKELIGWRMWNVWGESHLPKYENNFYDDHFKEIIFGKLRNGFNIDDYELLWMQMTQYQDLEYLRNHLDGKKNKTMIILLTDGFTGGDTLLDSNKVEFGKGDAIFFDGYLVYHQVTLVESGVRNAMNIWLNPKKNKLI
jgi:hypothetical protein